MIDVPKDARVRLEPYLKALDMEPDKHWHSVPKWVLTLALAHLDAQEAAGKGVTGEMVRIARAASVASMVPLYLGHVPEIAVPTPSTIRSALLAVHPAIFAAGERVGLEKAALAAEGAALPAGYQWGHDAMEQFDFGKECAATAIRSLKGGTP